jgi:hypothetical protein
MLRLDMTNEKEYFSRGNDTTHIKLQLLKPFKPGSAVTRQFPEAKLVKANNDQYKSKLSSDFYEIHIN